MHFGMSCGLAIKWPFAVDREDLEEKQNGVEGTRNKETR